MTRAGSTLLEDYGMGPGKGGCDVLPGAMCLPLALSLMPAHLSGLRSHSYLS